MTTDSKLSAASLTPTSVAVAKILAVGGSTGSMLVLMAAMAVGQQSAATGSPVDPGLPTQPFVTANQVAAPGPTPTGPTGSSRTRRVAEVPRQSAPKRAVSSWSAPKAAPRRTSTPTSRSVPTAPRVAPVKPAPTPAPRPVVRPAPPTHTPNATTRAS